MKDERDFMKKKPKKVADPLKIKEYEIIVMDATGRGVTVPEGVLDMLYYQIVGLPRPRD